MSLKRHFKTKQNVLSKLVVLRSKIVYLSPNGIILIVIFARETP